MPKWLSLLCRLKKCPLLILALAILFLIILYLLRHWLNELLLLYIAFLAFLGLLVLMRMIVGFLRKWCRKKNPVSEPVDPGKPEGPIKVPSHTYKRPDPMIYCQHYLMSQGLAVTWNNPDIQLYDNNTPVSSHELATDKNYSIKAQVWNTSSEAPAVNVVVKFYYLDFGIGTIKKYIGQTLVNVPVKGAIGSPAIAEYLWKTPANAGHYCLQVELEWPDDANPHNNLGQENVDVKKLNSPNASFTFTLRNHTLFNAKVHLTADTYTIPKRRDCPESTESTDKPSPGLLVFTQDTDLYAKHRQANYPIPDGWTFTFLPGEHFDLKAEEETQVTVKVVAKDGFVGEQWFNVNAWDRETLLGGVTLKVHS